MKVTQNVYIPSTKMDRFLRNPSGDCYTLSEDRSMDNLWTFVGVVEFEVDINTGKMIDSVCKEIDKTITELKTAIAVAETRKAELLALPAPDDAVYRCDNCNASWSGYLPECPACEYDDQIDDESRDEQLAEEGRVFDSQRDRS